MPLKKVRAWVERAGFIVYLGVGSVAFGLSNDLRIGRERLLAVLETLCLTVFCAAATKLDDVTFKLCSLMRLP